ncbi:MAG: hemolysin family protein [bacterium]|nr:hemolysin family protein [bacterium]
MNSLLLFLTFLFMSFVFSSSEMSFVASDKLFVRIKSKSSAPFRLLRSLLENPKIYLYTVLVGNNIANTALTMVAESALLENNSVSSSLILSLGVSGVVLLFGEILPKMIATAYPEKISVVYAPFIRILYVILYPLILVSSSVAEFAMKILKKNLTGKENTRLSAADVEQLILSNVDIASSADYESKMLKGIFRFSDKIVGESMIPRRDSVFINVDESISSVRSSIRSAQKPFTRYPVYENSEDNVIGVLNANDAAVENPPKIKNILRKILFFPETLTLDMAIIEMKKSGIHMAAVIDEYGGVAGIVTFEDIIEELIGDISDEYDIESDIEENGGKIMLDGDERIDDINEKLSLKLPVSPKYDTIAGLLMEHLGRIPEENDIAVFKNICKIRVVKVKNFTAKKIEIERTNRNEE